MDSLLTFMQAWFYGFVIMASISTMSCFVFDAWFRRTCDTNSCVGFMSLIAGAANLTYFAWMSVTLLRIQDVMSRSALSNAITLMVLVAMYFYCRIPKT